MIVAVKVTSAIAIGAILRIDSRVLPDKQASVDIFDTLFDSLNDSLPGAGAMMLLSLVYPGIGLLETALVRVSGWSG
jgi:hypothetical protein